MANFSFPNRLKKTIHSNYFIMFQIAEAERLQELNMGPGPEYAFQAYLARNVLQLNLMEEGPSYPRLPEKKNLHLG